MSASPWSAQPAGSMRAQLNQAMQQQGADRYTYDYGGYASSHASAGGYSSSHFNPGPGGGVPPQDSPSMQSMENSMDMLGLDDEFEEETVRIFVSWQGMLEPMEINVLCTIMELARFVESAPEAAPAHKFFIFRGVQLHPSFTVEQSLIVDGAVLHLVLNADPYRGRPLYVRVKDGKEDEVRMRMIMCGADFYIRDVKEELAYMAGEVQPEEMRLLFAGRELQDQHTLREYNIQKPSVLVCLHHTPHTGRLLSDFLQALLPPRDALGVAVTTRVCVALLRAEAAEEHFWGQLLGAPDLATLRPHHLQVTASNAAAQDLPVPGRVEVDVEGARVWWRPEAGRLLPATHYKVHLHKKAALALARAEKAVAHKVSVSEEEVEEDADVKQEAVMRHSRANKLVHPPPPPTLPPAHPRTHAHTHTYTDALCR